MLFAYSSGDHLPSTRTVSSQSFIYLARNTWPKTHRPRRKMKPRGETKSRLPQKPKLCCPKFQHAEQLLMIKRLRTQVLKKLNIFYWCSLLRQFDGICGYKGFSRSLVFEFGVFSDNILVCFNLWFQILRPTFPGMMRYIAKNIFNLVNPSFLFDITK